MYIRRRAHFQIDMQLLPQGHRQAVPMFCNHTLQIKVASSEVRKKVRKKSTCNFSWSWFKKPRIARSCGNSNLAGEQEGQTAFLNGAFINRLHQGEVSNYAEGG